MTKKILKHERLYGEKYESRLKTGMRRGHKVIPSITTGRVEYMQVVKTSNSGVKHTHYIKVYKKTN